MPQEISSRGREVVPEDPHWARAPRIGYEEFHGSRAETIAATFAAAGDDAPAAAGDQVAAVEPT